MGYMRAHTRLRDAYSQAYALHPDKDLDEASAEEIWIELFEALNWLDALRLSPEGKARMDPDLADALMFVRGRVHHVFADAIEFRRDLLVFLGPTTPGKSGQFGPLPVADWCWLQTAALAGKRSSSASTRKKSGETAYDDHLSGRQVSPALDRVASLAAELYTASLATPGAPPP
jgi:hypothetical protein